MSYTLEQVDVVRERMGVGYAEAKRALDEADGDVVAALAAIESRQSQEQSADDLQETIRKTAQEVKEALAGRAIERLYIKLDDHTLREVPVALVGVKAGLLTILSALLAHLRLEIIPSEDAAGGQTEGH